MHLTTRQALPEDSEFVFTVKKETLGSYIGETWGWNEEFQYDYHLKVFNPGNTNILSLPDKGDIGYLELEESESFIAITGLYILEEFQSHGVGTLVIEGVIQRAKERGLPVRIGVLKVNMKAKRLYEKLGFQVDSETATHFALVKSS